MSDSPRDLWKGATTAARDPADGLGADDLRAEQSTELPDREAMSILDVGGVEVGLPPPDYLDDLIEVPVPIGSQPVDGLPVEQYPIDRLPIDGLPVETVPVDQPGAQPLPNDQPVVGVPDSNSLPEEPGRLV